MGFTGLRDVVDKINQGRSRYFGWRKVPNQTTTAGFWIDLSMAPGNPVPNFYASEPLVANTFNSKKGLYHGEAVAPDTKQIKTITAMASAVGGSASVLVLCDYLLYYPFIDQSVAGPSVLDNTVTLPRFQSGEGVQAMVVLVASQTGGSTFQVTYTNSQGVAGRVTPVIKCSSQTQNGSIINTSASTSNTAGPFIPLQGNDTGIRSIQSVEFLSADVGLVSVVLVKPIATIPILDVSAPVEKDFITAVGGILPSIHDNAYLNFLMYPSGNASGVTLMGDLQVVW